ncbi:hypothetical protein BC940DRAFT_2313 [Gongronella butleri]|nr:hypothetical protein BC940DRAFT_2313 [Gongronella butleri]
MTFHTQCAHALLISFFFFFFYRAMARHVTKAQRNCLSSPLNFFFFAAPVIRFFFKCATSSDFALCNTCRRLIFSHPDAFFGWSPCQVEQGQKVRSIRLFFFFFFFFFTRCCFCPRDCILSWDKKKPLEPPARLKNASAMSVTPLGSLLCSFPPSGAGTTAFWECHSGPS